MIPENESYANAPPSRVSPPYIDVVAMVAFVPLSSVLILNIGLAVVDVAIVHAYGELLTIVEVAALRNERFRNGAEEDPNVIRLESKNAFPARANIAAGEDVPTPSDEVAYPDPKVSLPIVDVEVRSPEEKYIGELVAWCSVPPMVVGVKEYEPPAPPETSFAQITFPEESVVSLPEFVRPEQLAVERVRPPVVICIPPANVDVAVEVEVIYPTFR